MKVLIKILEKNMQMAPFGRNTKRKVVSTISNLSYRYIRSSYEGRTADALALGADERRDKLR